ncbi:hypothetical protein [Paenibacillus sp. GYB003]|uniref:hypothetical protein n=1 Tax=Paenibacillus sp. GYB003 TaxID=2994392 RepID=UPI002F96E670
MSAEGKRGLDSTLDLAAQDETNMAEEVVFMKRILGFFLFVAIFALLVGCESRGSQPEVTKTDTPVSTPANISDKEVKDILNRLIPKALDMYGIFNGSGSFKVDVTKTIPHEAGYALVLDPNYKSVADLKKAVEDIFTKDIAQKVFYSRCLTPEKDRPLYKDYDGKLYVDTNNGGKGWATKYLIDTAKLKGQKYQVAEIELDTTVLDEPADKLIVKIENVNGKWLLASRLD